MIDLDEELPQVPLTLRLLIQAYYAEVPGLTFEVDETTGTVRVEHTVHFIIPGAAFAQLRASAGLEH